MIWQNLIFGFPLAKVTPKYRWDFQYWHMDMEATRLYQLMGV